MLNKLQTIKLLLSSRNSGNLGDFAILKSDLFGAKVNPEINAKLQQVVEYHPPIDLQLLS